MAAIVKFLCLVFLCGLIVGGHCQPCTEDKYLTILQSATGKLVQNKQEWSVTITNDCDCTRLSVKLRCDGFETVKDVDPSILTKLGSVCVLSDGRPIHAHDTLKFTYAWDTAFPFQLLYSQIACS